jgi:biotin carboxyl carrier protein
MRLENLVALLKWPLAAILLGGLLALAYFVHGQMQEERAREASAETVQSPRRVKDAVVDLGSELAERLGLKDAPAQAVEWAEPIVVYGRVIPNPRATAEVRSPFAGTLRAVPDGASPVPGKQVRAGEILGWVDIRVGPQERLTLKNSLNDARHRYQGALEVLKVQQARVDRLQKTGGADIVSGNELDTARVALADAQTQVATAKSAVELYEKALEQVEQPNLRKDTIWTRPLTAPADGEVIQLAGRPGTAVEAGTLVFQLMDFRHPLVRLDIPPELLGAGPPARVDLFAVPATPPLSRSALSRPEVPEPPPAVPAWLTGPAPHLDVASQFVSYWYDVSTLPASGDAKSAGREAKEGLSPSAVWRPGLQVQAYVNSPAAKPQPTVTVPVTAVLYRQGQALVYVRVAPGQYEYREVSLLGREGDRWFLAPPAPVVPRGVKAGEPVVYQHAQVLLSEEFRIEGGGND